MTRCLYEDNNMAQNIKKHLKKKEQPLSKAIDDTASSLTEVGSGLLGGLLSAAADAVKESLFGEDKDD